MAKGKGKGKGNASRSAGKDESGVRKDSAKSAASPMQKLPNAQSPPSPVNVALAP